VAIRHRLHRLLSASHVLFLSPAALSQFQALDKDGNGFIDVEEFSAILNLEPDSERAKYVFNALDVDRNGQLSYKEFMIVAAHFNSVSF